jgi:hypothetical protein
VFAVPCRPQSAPLAKGVRPNACLAPCCEQKGVTKLKNILEGLKETQFDANEYMNLYTCAPQAAARPTRDPVPCVLGTRCGRTRTPRAHRTAHRSLAAAPAPAGAPPAASAAATRAWEALAASVTALRASRHLARPAHASPAATPASARRTAALG